MRVVPVTEVGIGLPEGEIPARSACCGGTRSPMIEASVESTLQRTKGHPPTSSVLGAESEETPARSLATEAKSKSQFQARGNRESHSFAKSATRMGLPSVKLLFSFSGTNPRTPHDSFSQSHARSRCQGISSGDPCS